MFVNRVQGCMLGTTRGFKMEANDLNGLNYEQRVSVIRLWFETVSGLQNMNFVQQGRLESMRLANERKLMEERR